MIGAQAAKILASRISDIKDLYTMSSEELANIEMIGPTMANSIRIFFDRVENQSLIERLRTEGVNLKSTTRQLGAVH